MLQLQCTTAVDCLPYSHCVTPRTTKSTNKPPTTGDHFLFLIFLWQSSCIILTLRLSLRKDKGKANDWQTTFLGSHFFSSCRQSSGIIRTVVGLSAKTKTNIKYEQTFDQVNGPKYCHALSPFKINCFSSSLSSSSSSLHSSTPSSSSYLHSS